MRTKTNLSRITVDIPKVDHRKLKAMAAMLGKSMREIIIEAIEEHIESQKTYNKKTLKALENATKGKGLIKAKDAEDFFNKLGI